MLFATTELASRIESAQAQLLVDFIEAIRAEREDKAIFSIPIAGGVAAYAGPESPLNKIAGLGFGGSLDPEELDAIERRFADCGAPVEIEISNLAVPDVGSMLTRRGYALMGSMSALACPPPASVGSPTGDSIEIRRCAEDELERWLEVMVTGFCNLDAQGVQAHEEFSRDALERAIGETIRTKGMVHYIAMLDGQPAGGASMRIADGLAHLCGAATIPEARRRGVQGALLSRRLAEAHDTGCDLALVETLPGSKSQENVQRRGFQLLYSRAVLVRDLNHSGSS